MRSPVVVAGSTRFRVSKEAEMPIALNSSGTCSRDDFDFGQNICALAVLRIRQTFDVNTEIKVERGRASSNASIVIYQNKFAQHSSMVLNEWSSS